MSKTEKNLKEAFAGESQANRKYLAFAKKADAEGHHQAAKLFRAAAAAETIHAHNHLNAMNGVGKNCDDGTGQASCNWQNALQGNHQGSIDGVLGRGGRFSRTENQR